MNLERFRLYTEEFFNEEIKREKITIDDIAQKVRHFYRLSSGIEVVISEPIPERRK